MDRLLPAQNEIVQAETAPRRGKDSPQREIHAHQPVDPASDFSVLAQALSDKDPALKEVAIQALAQSEGTQAMDLLRQAFTDLDSALKTMVIENIGSRPEAVPLLMEASQDSKESVREAARVWLDFQATQPSNSE
jgi:HEAT repeat protein